MGDGGDCGGPATDVRAALDAAGCARMFDEFATTAASRAPLYARLSTGIAADPALAARLLVAPATQRQPVLLFACIHALLLDDPTEPLARHYPNLTTTPDESDPLPAFRDFCRDHRDDLDHLLATRQTQTNEIGRCALLLPAVAMVAEEVGPVAHLDVGTSAGLNLLLGRFHYRYEPGGELGPPSPVTLTCGVRGAVPIPAAMPAITSAVGIDPAPVDLTDERQARWLEACVWPDQTDRFDRLRAAIGLATEVGVDVRRGDAVADTSSVVDELSAVGHPVVTNTWVLNYLTHEQRTAYVEALEEVARRIDVSWVYAEMPLLVSGIPMPESTERSEHTVLTVVRWRGGRRTVDHLADCHPHGYWLHGR